jgi:hypothetical protein
MHDVIVYADINAQETSFQGMLLGMVNVNSKVTVIKHHTIKDA